MGRSIAPSDPLMVDNSRLRQVGGLPIRSLISPSRPERDAGTDAQVLEEEEEEEEEMDEKEEVGGWKKWEEEQEEEKENKRRKEEIKKIKIKEKKERW